MTAPVYQPLLDSGPETLADVLGAVWSILTAGLLVAVVVLPALSLTEALVVRPVPSLLIVLSAGQAPSIPEPPALSLQVQATVTLLLYQPAALGLVVGAPLSDGATLSMLTVTVVLVLLPA